MLKLLRHKKTIFTGSSALLAVLLLSLLYWFSAWRAAQGIVQNMRLQNIPAVDAEFDWAEILPAMADSLAEGLSAPNALHLESIVRSSFKEYYLSHLLRHRSSSTEIMASGFIGINRFAFSLASGSKYTIAWHDFTWSVVRITPTFIQDKKIAVGILAWTFPHMNFVLHDRGVYLDSPRYGVRLTDEKQNVVEFAVSPDKSNHWIAYIAKTSKKQKTAIWRLDLKTLKQTEVYKGTADVWPDEQSSLEFSPHGRILYFMIPKWATSSDILGLNVHTQKLREIAPGNEFFVVKQESLTAGDLIVQQHRYWASGGSYNPWVLITPDGKPIAMYRGRLSTARRYLPVVYYELPPCSSEHLRQGEGCLVQHN